MLIVLAILLFAIVIASWIRLSRSKRVTHFGWMSERWIAEYRSMH
jgi:hypothetical protein